MWMSVRTTENWLKRKASTGLSTSWRVIKL